MIKQNEVEGWSDEDEEQLQSLLAKRLKLSRGTQSHDIQFAADLLRGEAGERMVVDALSTGEVKRDFGAGNTGNVFVEHLSRGKKSGISTTKADWWIFILGGMYNDELFIGIKTSRLKKILKTITWEVLGGDGRTSKGKLVKLSKLLKVV